MTPKTNKAGPFPLGINNRTEDFAVPSGAVRDAVNVDITLDGRLRRRKGQTLFAAGASVSSLWARGGRAFFKDGGSLKQLMPDSTTVTLTTGLIDTRVAYVEVPGRGVAFSDGAMLKRIVDGAVLPFAVAPPQRSLTLVPSTGGSLPPGLYQAAATFITDSGEESGMLGSEQALVPANGMLTILLPQPTDSLVTMVGVYLSSTNGEDTYLVQKVPVGLDEISISVVPPAGRQAFSRFTLPLPPGDALAFYNGRVYSHANGLISYTEAWSGQHDPLENIIPMPEPVTVLHGTPAGVWIVADQTYFLSGDPGDAMNLKAVALLRGVKGTLIELPTGKDVMWFSERGFVLGKEDGSIELLQDSNVSVLPASEGASLHRDQDGLRQVISAVKGPGVSVAAASTWFTASISSREARNEF